MSLTIDTSILPSDVEIDRHLVEAGGLSAFIRLAWGKVEPGQYKHNWHIDLLCRELQDLYAGIHRKMVIMVPPGSMKTLLTGVFGPAFAWIKHPELKWISATYGGSLALKTARQMRDLVSSDWYRERWPHVQIPYQNNRASAFFKNSQKGFRFSSSVGGEVTGNHGDIIVGDDLNKTQDAMGNAGLNLTGLDTAWEHWSKTLPTRQSDAANTRRLLIGQCLHESDVPARWVESDPDVRVVCLPMRYERDHPHCHPDDPRTEEGAILWPAHIPEEEVVQLERTMGPVISAAQLQQRPSPIGGAVFRREWCTKLWKRLPDGIQFAQTWDFTFGSVGSSSSWVVGQVWGWSGANRYKINQVRARVEYPAMRDMVRHLSARHPEAMTKLVEDKAAGKPLVQDLRNEISGLVEVKISSTSGGKLARAQAVTGIWEAGNVYLPHPTMARMPDGTAVDASWVGGFIERLCRFKGAPSDIADEVDAMSQMLSWIERHHGSVDWGSGADSLRAQLQKRVVA